MIALFSKEECRCPRLEEFEAAGPPPRDAFLALHGFLKPVERLEARLRERGWSGPALHAVSFGEAFEALWTRGDATACVQAQARSSWEPRARLLGVLEAEVLDEERAHA